MNSAKQYVNNEQYEITVHTQKKKKKRDRKRGRGKRGMQTVPIASRVENYWPHIHVGSFFYSIFLGRNRILVLLVFCAPIVSYFVRRNKFTWVGAWVSFFF